MKRGFMLPFLILGLLGLGVFYVAYFSSIQPNKKTQETAQSIPKYARAATWQVVNNQTLCLFDFNNCTNPPSQIVFTSEDSWDSIYNTYKTNMGDFGWKTNSRIVTSIPTNIVFENDQGCSLELAENTTVFRDRDRESEQSIFYYVFKVYCKD